MIDTKFISTNHQKGRNGNTITSIVLHTYNGKGRSLFNWFSNPQSGVSAHYAIFLDGNGEQYVSHSDTAWHAGDANVNVQSIGIEHQDNGNSGDSVRTNEMYEASAQLVARLCKEFNIPCRRGRHGILEHREVTSTGCPGGLDVNRIIRRANEILTPPPLVDDYYRIFEGDKQINAYKLKDNVVSFYYYNFEKNLGVTFQNKNITSEIKTMATQVQKEIEELKASNEALAGKVIEFENSLNESNRLVQELREKTENQRVELAKFNSLKKFELFGFTFYFQAK